jgi:hypothetical protein
MEINRVPGVRRLPLHIGYVHCVSDPLDRDSTSARALKHLVAVASPNVTVQSCLDSCAAGGFILAGVEFGDECCECGPRRLVCFRD